MNASVYIFGELGNGYTQFPDDFTKDIFKMFASKISESKAQLIVHRNDKLMYYGYIQKLDTSQEQYIGVCVVVNGIMFYSISELFDFYQKVIANMVYNGEILEFSEKAEITSKVDKLYEKEQEIKLIMNDLGLLDDIKQKKLPPVSFDLSDTSVKCFDETEEDSIIVDAACKYGYVFVLKDKNVNSPKLTSYKGVISRLNKEKEELKHQGENDSSNKGEEKNSSNGKLITFIVCLLLVALSVGGYFYYNQIYIPDKIDREAPRYFTFAKNVILRSSQMSGVDYNKVCTLPFGTKLITYEHNLDWSTVKTDVVRKEDRQNGYISSNYLLDAHDFFLLNSMFGDEYSRVLVESSKCRRAVLNYFKDNNYIGVMSSQIRDEAGISTFPTAENQWQIFSLPQTAKYNYAFFKRLYNRDSKYTDFAVIIKNISTGDRKMLYFYFDDDETPHLLTEQSAPSDGAIKNIIYQDSYLLVDYI